MAIDKIGIYNNALRLVGETRLDSLTEDRESRHDLDGVYSLGALEYCLEVVKPKFATRTTALTGAATTGGVSLAFTHTLPSDFITIIGVYSDAELDQPVSRYIQEGTTILCDYATIYLRYTHSDVTDTDFTHGFARVLANYLAREIVWKFDPGRYDTIDASLQAITEQVIETEGEKEPSVRPATPSSSLSATWRKIYNGALMILGKPKLPAGDTDHPDRVACDTSVDEGVVSGVMEDTEWLFGLSSVKIDYDPSITVAWGYQYAFNKPSDMLRMAGIWGDEYFRTPIKNYVDEGDNWMCNANVIYVKYIDNDFVVTPDVWPTYFSRLVSAKIAQDIAAVVNPASIDRADTVYEKRKSSAMSNDAMQSPPLIFTGGSWVRSRGSRRGDGRVSW